MLKQKDTKGYNFDECQKIKKM